MSSLPLPDVAPLLGATVFVTGGSGFVGRALIPYLLRHAKVKQVRALARSTDAAKVVEGLGATAVRGDMHDLVALRTACTGVSHVFHLAAAVKIWGNYDDIHHDTVHGTQNILQVARAAGVRRFIHCSTEAVLAGGSARIINADEKTPIPNAPKSFPYSRTKALAERAVVEANSDEMATIVCRPRFIWGRDDTVVLAALAKTMQSGSFKWCNQGNYVTSHVHIENVCEGFVLAATRGRPGGVYFLADGPADHFRTFITRYVATQKITAPAASSSIPFPVIYGLAYTVEWIWWLLSFVKKMDEPFVVRQAVVLFMREVSVDDTRARQELGYTAHKSVDEGMAELERDHAAGKRLV